MKIWAAIIAIASAAILSGFTLRGSPTGAVQIVATYVQGTNHQNGATSSTTIATLLPSKVGVGDAVFVSIGWVSTAGDTVTGVTDDKGNTYTIVDTNLINSTTGYTWVSAYALNVQLQPQTITATLSTARTFVTAVVDEFSGLPSTAVLDGHAINGQKAWPPASGPVTSGTATIGANDFVYGSTVNVEGFGTELVGAGFTQAQHTSGAFISEYKNLASSGSQAATFVPTVLADWNTFMLAFKVTSSPSTIVSAGPTSASYTSGILSTATIAPVSITMSPASPTFSGTLSLIGTTNFALSSPTLPSNLVATGTTPTCTTSTAQAPFNIVATQAGAIGSPLTQSVTVTCNPAAPPTIAGVGPTSGSYTSGISGATIGAVSVTMSPTTPTFSGTLSLSTTNFALSSTTLPANLITNGTTPTCTTSTVQTPFNIVATQAGATGSPFTQSVTITCNPVAGPATTSLFKPTDTPSTIDSADPLAGVYGVQFTPQTSGNATGCKFYKAPTTNTGPHICTLWSNSGTQLATVTFAGETASGWQTQAFSSSVALTAGTQYVIGVWMPAGHYSNNQPFFNAQYTSDVDGQLIAPATGSTTNGHGNGVYSQSVSSTFPISTFQSTNYWADVVFQYTPVPQSINLVSLSGTSITNNAPSGTIVGTASATMAPSTPFFTGTFSLSQTQGGCNSTNGANNASFAIASGSTLQTNVSNIGTGSYSICVLATQASATNSPSGQPFTITSSPQTISAVSLSSNSFPPSTAGPVGTASATMTPTTPNFTGSWSVQTTGSVAGTTCDTSGFFTFSGSTLNVSASATTTTYHVCIVATQSGATGSPFAGVVNLTGTTGGNVAFTLPCQSGHAEPCVGFRDVLHYMSPTGSDSNDGLTTGTAWATPNHALNCGDVIIAAAGTTYGAMNITTNASNCPSTTGGIDGTGGVNFAIVLCGGASVGDCQINSSGFAAPAAAWRIYANNWAIEGWQVHLTDCCGSGRDARGFVAFADLLGDRHHHNAFINDIATDDGQGFSTDEGGHIPHAAPGNGMDYVAYVGDIAHNASNWGLCIGAMDITAPINWDTVAGTHIYVNGSIAWDNISVPCITTNDSSSLYGDTWNAHGFTQKAVYSNNISWGAQRAGLVLTFNPELSAAPTVNWYNNTLYNNSANLGHTGEVGGEIELNGTATSTLTIVATNNIAYNTKPNSGGGTNNAYGVNFQNGVWTSITFGTTGNENIITGSATGCYQSGTNATFDFCSDTGNPTYTATNFYHENPGFANLTDLNANWTTGTPNCSGFTNVTACMGWNATTSTQTANTPIADLVPSSAHSAGKGYQKPSTTCVNSGPIFTDYPRWLKGVVYLHWNGTSITENADLVTKPCGL